MSFILEALRKSEHERQRQAGPIVANPYAAPRRSQLPLGWMIGIAALLVINVAVVLVLVLRDEPLEQAKALTPPPAQSAPPPATTPPAQAPDSPPQQEAPHTVGTEEPSVATPETVEQTPAVAAREEDHEPLQATPAPAPGSVPTINELNLQGADALPPLHLDIHVYAVKPEERFIFLNAHKYREGAQTAEGLTVEAITPGGVILDRNGLRFLLPRP